MKKLFTILFFAVTATVFSQDSFWNNVRFGGGIGFGFSNNSTTFAISPTALYDFNDQFSLGAGVGYQYSKRNDLKTNVYSISALSLYNPINEIQLSAEFEELFANQKLDGASYSTNIPALYLGAAYRVSRNVSLGVRYDVLYDENKSIFGSAFSPIVRVFF